MTDPGMHITDGVSDVCLDGCEIGGGFLYLMLHKPAGVLSASRDPNAKTVIDLVAPELRRKGLFPAGRLDRDTTGFALITDDGALAHRILSPKRHVEKEYEVWLTHPATQADAALFAQGMTLPGGEALMPAELLLDRPGCDAVVMIREGRYHQIKRMFEVTGNSVTALKRTRIGGVRLDAALMPGESRRLTVQEIAALEQQCGE